MNVGFRWASSIRAFIIELGLVGVDFQPQRNEFKRRLGLVLWGLGMARLERGRFFRGGWSKEGLAAGGVGHLWTAEVRTWRWSVGAML